MQALGIPFVLLVVGIPLGLLWLLIHSKHKDSRMKEPFVAFLGVGYRKELFAWEVWVICKKALVVIVIVFLAPYGLMMQAVTALLIVLVAMLLHVSKRPYESTMLHKLEAGALFTQTGTIIAGE